MELFKNDYVSIRLDQENSYIIEEFLSKTEEMNDDEFKKVMKTFVSFVEQYKPKGEIINSVNMGYVIVPEMQEWMNETIFPKVLNIFKKAAFVVSKDIFAQTSVEQTMDEDTGQGFETRYFDDEDKAIKWICE